MEDKIIDGKKLAEKREEKLIKEIKGLPKTPKIVSLLVGTDAPSVLYTNIKQKKACEMGICFEALKFPADMEFDQVLSDITQLNEDPEVDGIMVQLPLPKEFLKNKDEHDLLEAIDGKKDIDGLTSKKVFLSATAKAVVSIIEDEKISVYRKKVVVVGASDLVGKPVATELSRMGAIVEVCDSKTGDLKSHTQTADVLISATGVPNLIKGDMVKQGVVVIDVGAEKVDGKLVGDVDFASVAPKAFKITPVPGGVGPMTVISLMENVVQSVLT